MKDVNPDDLYFPKKGEKPSGVWAKGRQEANKFRVDDAFLFKKNMSSLKQGKSMTSGHIGYFNNTTMKNAFKYATGNTLTKDQVSKLDDAIIYGMVKGTTDDNMKTVFKSINSQIKKGVSFDTIVSNLKSKKTANAYIKYVKNPKKVPTKKVNVARGGTKRKRVVSEAKKKGNSLIDGM